MEKLQPTGFHHLLKRTLPHENRRKIHHSSSPKTVKNGGSLLPSKESKNGKRFENTDVEKYPSSHRFVKMLVAAVNKMHDTKVLHEKISEYNLALMLCHKINVLFTVQQTFVDAEALALVMYNEEFVNSVVDVLIEGGDLAYIPGQLLVHLTMYDKCVEYLLKDGIIAIICGVLRVGERRFSTIGIVILRNLADFCQSKASFASKMRSRTNVLKLMLQRFVSDLYSSNNNYEETKKNTDTAKTLSDDDNYSMGSSVAEHIYDSDERNIYSIYNSNNAMEMLVLIEFIISVTTSRSHIDELRDIVNEAIASHKKIEADHEEGKNSLHLNLNIEEVMKKAFVISEGANRRKHHVTKDIDYEKANKSRRKDGYAAANI